MTDFRSWDIHLELLTLHDYLDVLDNQLATLLERERERIWRDVDPDDRDANDGAMYQQTLLDEGISIRFLTAAGLIAVWAIYESAVSSLADRLRAARGLSIRMSDLKGDTLSSAERYFDDILRLHLHLVPADCDQLKDVLAVRNALAHANGRLEDVPEKKREKLKALAASDPTLIIREGYLIVSRKYVRAVWALVDRLLSDLISRVDHEIAHTH